MTHLSWDCIVLQVFRQFLLSEGFVEIHTPKLIAGSSEGGAAVFKLDYKGQPACLAQSPQLHKQMSICGDFGRVLRLVLFLEQKIPSLTDIFVSLWVLMLKWRLRSIILR